MKPEDQKKLSFDQAWGLASASRDLYSEVMIYNKQLQLLSHNKYQGPIQIENLSEYLPIIMVGYISNFNSDEYYKTFGPENRGEVSHWDIILLPENILVPIGLSPIASWSKIICSSDKSIYLLNSTTGDYVFIDFIDKKVKRLKNKKKPEIQLYSRNKITIIIDGELKEYNFENLPQNN